MIVGGKCESQGKSREKSKKEFFGRGGNLVVSAGGEKGKVETNKELADDGGGTNAERNWVLDSSRFDSEIKEHVHRRTSSSQPVRPGELVRVRIQSAN